MKKVLLIMVVFFTVCFTGCSAVIGLFSEVGNGTIVTQEREIENFTAIEISGAYSTEIIIGDKPSISIEADENLLEFITTENDGDKLGIRNSKSIYSSHGIRIKVTVPDLNKLQFSGAGSVYVENISADKFNVRLSGAGSINLQGKVDKLEAGICGAGSLHAIKMISNEVHVSVSGAASADVYAGKSLHASVSGVGSVGYYGNPVDVKKNISGNGSISGK